MAVPVVAVGNHVVNCNVWVQLASWITYFDADGNPPVLFQFLDSGADALSGYIYTPDNPHWSANTTITVSVANLANVWVRGGQADGVEVMKVQAFDGTGWSNWASFILTTNDNPPVATISNHSLHEGEWAQVKNWLTYSDADGDAVTRFQFWDGGAGADSGYFYTPGDTHHAANTALEVAASDLQSVWIQGGQTSGPEAMYVRAFDGNLWSSWAAFTLTTLRNTQPTATIGNLSLHEGQWVQIKNSIFYQDPDGDAATKYKFVDAGTGADSGYFYTPGDPHHAANTELVVAASDLDSVWLRGGNASGTELIYFQAFDGHDWSDWNSFVLTTLPNIPPTATIGYRSLHEDEWIQIKNLITYSDPDSSAPATKYEFLDGGAGADSGYFYTPGDPHHAANTNLTVAASDLDGVWLRGGGTSGTETLWLHAFDGHDWSNWTSFTLETLLNHQPTATIGNLSLHEGQWAQIKNSIFYQDPDGDAATKYKFVDAGTGADSGYFYTPGDPHHAANTELVVAASDLDSVWLRGGNASGTELIYVQAFDGHDWSDWNSFTLTTLPNTPPVATINNQSLAINQWARVDSWLSYSDVENNPATKYQFLDVDASATSGYFWTPDNSHQPAGVPIEVNAADLGGVWVRSAQLASSDSMNVRAFDGTDWGPWDSFVLTAHA